MNNITQDSEDHGTYQQEQIVEMGSATAESENGVIHCLTIVGQMVSINNKTSGLS